VIGHFPTDGLHRSRGQFPRSHLKGTPLDATRHAGPVRVGTRCSRRTLLISSLIETVTDHLSGQTAAFIESQTQNGIKE
jgi:hypothetical protein